MRPCFIIDTNALLGDLQELRMIVSTAELLITPGVLDEVKTAKVREQVNLLLPGLETRTPTKDSVARVIAFARKTGDVSVLSPVDVELIALVRDTLLQRAPANALHDAPQAPTDKAGSGVQGWVQGDSEEDGWIGPPQDPLPQSPVDVPAALVSSDFAMQNVCLQMGVPVLSADGRRITRLRGYQLACDSCQRTTKQTTARFCPHCGHATLARLTCEYAADGSTTFFRKRNRQVNLRGVRYPLPQPKGGRHRDLILCEDDLSKPQVRAMIRAQRRGNPWDDAENDALQRVEVGYGRKNPNVNSFWKNRRR